MFEIIEKDTHREGARIVVIGVGGAGGNAIQTMMSSGVSGVDFIVANTDLQALEKNKAEKKIQLGKKLTRGLGAGANPNVGRQAAIESCEYIASEIDNTDMVFITAGMGGGTGTGAASVIADIARQKGVLTVGVVTRPFSFEGRRRSFHADVGIDALRNKVDTLIVIPNDKLLTISDRETPILNTFRKVDDVLVKAVRGISDLINTHGLINLDFADIRTVMFEKGFAIMGVGQADGDNRVIEATRRAIQSPLLDNISIKGAKGVIINVTGDKNLSLTEVNEASQMVTDLVHDDAEIIFGAVIDETCSEKNVYVTVIATGFDDAEAKNSVNKKSSPQEKEIKNSEVKNNKEINEMELSSKNKKETSSGKNKMLPRDRLLQKAKDYRDANDMSNSLEIKEKCNEKQLSMGIHLEENSKKNDKDSSSPFGKKFFKGSLSFFLDK